MPQERQHDSNADRQRAYRERKRNAEGPESVTPEPAEEAVTEWAPPVEMMRFEGVELPVVRGCSWTEEQFVSHELKITRQQFGHEPPEKLRDRMKRSERYLRWRYRGFRTGQIAGL